MKIIPPESWQPCDGIQLEDDANKAVRCSDNHVLVIAGPGAGKTELLAQKAAFLFQTNRCKNPQKILAISFKKDAAQNLKERVEQRCGDDVKGRFVSMTYDAFAKSILDHFLYALPEELRPSQNYLVNDSDVIDAAFRQSGYNPDGFKPSGLNAEYDLLLARVDLPISGNEVWHRAWLLLLHGFGGKKATLTFKMIMKLASYIVKSNPYIKRALQMTYSYVFLDEFQDTTDIQYDFVKECFFDSNVKITAVGDNKQRIMLWAGAKRTAFLDFHKELQPEGIRLTMNHRSAPRLVALQRAMYESLKERKTEVIVPDKWDENDGNITLIIAENEHLEANTIVSGIIARIKAGTKPKDICILCKQRPQVYAPTVITELKKNGIRARIETDYQDLIKEPVVDLLIKFMQCVNNRSRPVEWSFVIEEIVDLWGIGETQESGAYDAMQRKLAAQADSIKEAVCQELDKRQWHDVLLAILTFFNVERIKAHFPAYQQGQYFEELIGKFEKLFFDEYVAACGDWEQAIENFCGEHSIPIMTIHKSKGLEYSAVYFIGLEDSAFWNFRKQPEEDRCAFFVALSRAKEAVTFSFCNQRKNLQYPNQRHTNINEFFELLQRPGVAKVLFVQGGRKCYQYNN